MEIYSAPLTPQIWRQFEAFFASREGGRLSVPPVPKAGVWIVVQDGTLLAGVCLYDTDGPFLLAEGLATNPGIPATLAHKAVTDMIFLVKAQASSRGKYIVVTPRVRGVAKILERHGFQVQRGVIMTSAPGLWIGRTK
jgi:hypothetical protein